MPVPTTNGGLPATLSASEFRGQEFVGFARTADGVDLSFRSPIRLQAGGTIHLRADPARVLVFAGGRP
jgi:putative spermidine/putrescine transport system ATP-binding protein